MAEIQQGIARQSHLSTTEKPRQNHLYGLEMDLETENKILLTIINFLKRFNYED